MIEGITDNKNRTSQEIKHLLSEHGATLAAPGAVAWAFSKINSAWQALAMVSINETEREALGTMVDALENNDAVRTIITNAQPQVSNDSQI